MTKYLAEPEFILPELPEEYHWRLSAHRVRGTIELAIFDSVNTRIAEETFYPDVASIQALQEDILERAEELAVRVTTTSIYGRYDHTGRKVTE